MPPTERPLIPRILALHGFTGRGADFAPLRAALGRRGGTARDGGLHWLAPDLPGHGANRSLDCTPEALLHWIDAQRATLLGAPTAAAVPPHPTEPQVAHNARATSRAPNNPILLGYSMGARAALLHACRRPGAWAGLILISPQAGIEAPGAREQRRAADAALADRIERIGCARFLEEWADHPLIRSQQTIPKAWREAMRANRLAHRAEGLAASLRQFGQGVFPNLWPELERIRCPVHLLTGSDDPKYDRIAKSLREALPTATHTTLAGAGHAPHLEQLGSFLSALNASGITEGRFNA